MGQCAEHLYAAESSCQLGQLAVWFAALALGHKKGNRCDFAAILEVRDCAVLNFTFGIDIDCCCWTTLVT
jgi:hypothetical protein